MIMCNKLSIACEYGITFIDTLRLSWCSCIHHNAIDASRCRCTFGSCQYKVSLGQLRVNLGQRDYQVARGRFLGNQNWAYFGCCKICDD